MALECQNFPDAPNKLQFRHRCSKRGGVRGAYNIQVRNEINNRLTVTASPERNQTSKTENKLHNLKRIIMQNTPSQELYRTVHRDGHTLFFVGFFTNINQQFQEPIKEALLSQAGSIKNTLMTLITFSWFLAYPVFGEPREGDEGHGVLDASCLDKGASPGGFLKLHGCWWKNPARKPLTILAITLT